METMTTVGQRRLLSIAIEALQPARVPDADREDATWLLESIRDHGGMALERPVRDF